jgi:glycolate oxidase FAD binding subunit
VSESIIAPDRIDELPQILAAVQTVIPVGANSKPPLSESSGAQKLSLLRLRGITQYEPSEFTFTALAGTPLAEIVTVLAEKNQYLPFDPLLVDQGATLGGTVAAGLSGSGRFRYGGIRDFLLAVHFISGEGKLIRSGGKVVKNAAGFDIPKFMVGSLGRFGVMTELTFKVFPRPRSTLTLGVDCQSHQQATERITMAASATWELDAIDYDPAARVLYLRIGGPEPVNRSLAERVFARWGSDVRTIDDAEAVWSRVRELDWGEPDAIVTKVPVTPTALMPLCQQLPGRLWFSAAANLLWHSAKDHQELTTTSTVLRELGLPGLIVRGPSDQTFVGCWQGSELQSALQRAFDPQGKFPIFMANHG